MPEFGVPKGSLSGTSFKETVASFLIKPPASREVASRLRDDGRSTRLLHLRAAAKDFAPAGATRGFPIASELFGVPHPLIGPEYIDNRSLND